jgi:hypothetical protein
MTAPAHGEFESAFPIGAYTGGYLVAPDACERVPNSWNRVRLRDGLQLAYHRRSEHASATRRAAEVHVVGDAYSTESPRRSASTIARRLAAALARSDAEFHAALDELHGRFVLIYRRSGDADYRLTSDATGMRAILYAPGARVAASHPGLAAFATGAQRLAPQPFTGYGLFGRSSGFEGIVMAVPNHEVDLATGVLARYWPREPIPELTPAQSAQRILPIMKSSLDGVARRHGTLVTSLTAGLDSRVTLAIALATKRVPAMTFFTYRRGIDHWIESTDLATAPQLASQFHLRHVILDVDGHPDPTQRWHEVVGLNTTTPDLPQISHMYTLAFGDSGAVHLRSNVSEVGRLFYKHKRYPIHAPKTGEDLATIHFHSRPSDVLPPEEGRAEAIAAFEEFFEATDFETGMRFVDGRDLFYWEHRMGAWHSQVVAESDPAFDSVSLFNSRVVLTAMLGPTPRQRSASAHLYELLYDVDPHLLDIPVNQRPDRDRRVPRVVLKREAEARRRRTKRRRRFARLDARVPGLRKARLFVLRRVRWRPKG